MKKILVLTYEEDPHANSVCNYLDKIGVEFFRINTDKLINNFSISFNSNDGFFSISTKDRGRLTIDQTWNIWNRRIIDPEVPLGISKDLEKIIITETKRTWESLLISHKGRVINKPQNQYHANSKIDQIRFVSQFGGEILIPDTLLTNNPEDLIKFYRNNPKICHKLQQPAVIEKDGECLISYTNIVSEDHLEHAELVRRNPCLFQTYIEKAYELRITALEDKIVGIAIYSQNSERSRIDFRKYDFDNVKYEKVELPKKVEDFCSNLIKHYGLSFGQIDMIVTPKEDYVFLEINPNGQWLWLEEQSKYNLTKDVAENLIK
ncbi:MAG: hypothetical protein KJ767_01650 [Nanoarchaeota archaeon]|nr:hypothetical protein [Nanoarchaeota archaeon]